MKTGELSLEAQELLGRLREGTSSSEEKERLLLALDALRFISATGQALDFEDYRKGLEAKAPPLVIAAFNTREEADTWLNSQPRPPHQAYVLIGGEYHIVMYVPELRHRRLVPHPILEFYLEDMIRDGLPAPVATFNTLAEATAWMEQQPEPPAQAFILIGGEHYLAAYHPRVNLRALYAISRAAKSVPDGAPGA